MALRTLLQNPGQQVTATNKAELSEFLLKQASASENRQDVYCLELLLNLVGSKPDAPEPEPAPAAAPVAAAPEPAPAPQAPPAVSLFLTWRQLRDFCNALPETVLGTNVTGYNDNEGGSMIEFGQPVQLQEPHYDFGYGYEPVSLYPEVPAEELAQLDGLPAGTPALYLCDHSTMSCRVCGCTNTNCRQCIEASGAACYWVGPYLCSRCFAEGKGGANG